MTYLELDDGISRLLRLVSLVSLLGNGCDSSGCFLAGTGARFLAIIGALIMCIWSVFVVVVCELD